MATLPFLLIGIWIASYFDNREKERKRKLNEFIKWCDQIGKSSCDSKPKYRMKEVSSEDEELFLTDLGDFDEAFKL